MEGWRDLQKPTRLPGSRGCKSSLRVFRAFCRSCLRLNDRYSFLPQFAEARNGEKGVRFSVSSQVCCKKANLSFLFIFFRRDEMTLG